MGCEPRGCPFCLTKSVELVASFDGTLIAYRCPACQGVFYTITPQFDTEPADESFASRQAPGTEAPKFQ
jgi:hypothetical protein